jgi:hypothetical protein
VAEAARQPDAVPVAEAAAAAAPETVAPPVAPEIPAVKLSREAGIEPAVLSRAQEVGQITKAIREGAEPPKPGQPVAEPAPLPEGQKLRRVNERALEAEGVPQETKAVIEQSPNKGYEPQKVAKVEAEAKARTAEELAADAFNPESNTATASAAELINRLQGEGKKVEAGNAILALAERGTTMGQLINQMKLLKFATPENIQLVIDTHLKKAGYDPLNPAKAEKFKGLADKSIKAADELNQAKEKFLADQSQANWSRVESALKKAEQADKGMNQFVSRVTPKNFGETYTAMMQGNLLAPISIPFNLYANLAGYVPRAMGRTATAMLDSSLRNLRKNKERQAAVAPISGTIAKYRAMGQEVVPALKEMVDPSGKDFKKGEIRSEVNAFRAWNDLKNYFFDNAALEVATKNGKMPMAQVGIRFFEGTFGLPADIMLRGLKIGDAIPRAGERARIIAEFGQLKKLSPEQIKRAEKAPELFFDRKTLEKIEFETDRAVFQQDNRATLALNKLMRTVTPDNHIKPLVHIMLKGVIPFAKTPINVLGEVLTFTPAGSIKLVSDISNGLRTGNFREANQTAGKIAVGTTVIGAGQYLYDKGVVTPSMMTVSPKERQGLYSTIGPAMINSSALKRYASGVENWAAPRPGDNWSDATKFGLSGALIQVGADFSRRTELLGVSGLESMSSIDSLAHTGMGAVSYTLNQGFTKNINTLLTSLSQGQSDKWLSSYLETVSAPFLPNTLEAVSRYLRDAKPEFRADDAWSTFENRVNSKLDPLGLKLPGTKGLAGLSLKRDIWGREIPEAPDGTNKAVNIFLDVSKTRQTLNDPVDMELYTLWRKTNNSAVWPSIPDGFFVDVEGVTRKMSPQQYEQYQATLGQIRRGMVEQVVGSQEWQEMPMQTRIEMLEYIYNQTANMSSMANKLLIDRSQTTIKPKPTSNYNP